MIYITNNDVGLDRWSVEDDWSGCVVDDWSSDVRGGSPNFEASNIKASNKHQTSQDAVGPDDWCGVLESEMILPDFDELDRYFDQLCDDTFYQWPHDR